MSKFPEGGFLNYILLLDIHQAPTTVLTYNKLSINVEVEIRNYNKIINMQTREFM